MGTPKPGNERERERERVHLPPRRSMGRRSPPRVRSGWPPWPPRSDPLPCSPPPPVGVRCGEERENKILWPSCLQSFWVTRFYFLGHWSNQIFFLRTQLRLTLVRLMERRVKTGQAHKISGLKFAPGSSEPSQIKARKA
jgi:hypothetical protein